MSISSQEYWSEVNSIAAYLVSEALEQSDNDSDQAMELINDTLLHEAIDGHQWVIYYSYNLSVLEHSENTDYGVDNGLVDTSIITERSLNDFHTALAYWALYADVQNLLDDKMQEAINTEEEGE